MEGNETVRVSIVGLGEFGQYIAGVIKRCKNLELVSCFTRNPETRKNFAKKYGCEEKDSYQAILNDKRIDGLILTSANHDHCKQAVIAAQHGKHVFVEKPIATNVADAKRMIEECQKSKVILMVGHNTRRLGGFRKIKSLLDDNYIGRVVLVEASISSLPTHPITPDEWRWSKDKCPGGPLLQLGIHFIDTLIYLFGPIAAVSSMVNYSYTNAETPDVTINILEFKSGALAYISSSYVITQETRFCIYGTKGNLLSIGMHENQILKCQVVEPDYTLKDTIVEIEKIDSFMEELTEFGNCIINNLKPEVSGRDGMLALALVEVAIRSAETGKKVYIDDIL